MADNDNASVVLAGDFGAVVEAAQRLILEVNATSAGEHGLAAVLASCIHGLCSATADIQGAEADDFFQGVAYGLANTFAYIEPTPGPDQILDIMDNVTATIISGVAEIMSARAALQEKH